MRLANNSNNNICTTKTTANKKLLAKNKLSNVVNKGFSLIELVVVIIIIAILSGVSVAMLVFNSDDNRLNNKTEEFKQLFLAARDEAILSSKFIRFNVIDNALVPQKYDIVKPKNNAANSLFSSQTTAPNNQQTINNTNGSSSFSNSANSDNRNTSQNNSNSGNNASNSSSNSMALSSTSAPISTPTNPTKTVRSWQNIELYQSKSSKFELNANGISVTIDQPIWLSNSGQTASFTMTFKAADRQKILRVDGMGNVTITNQ